MTNFSSFFPVAGGGGGFTKMNKYVTLRSVLDATHFEGSDNNLLRVHPVQQSGSSISVGSNEITFYGNVPSDGAFQVFQDRIDLLVGRTFQKGNSGQVYTITSIGPRISANASQAVQFTPSLTVSIPVNDYCYMDLSFTHTVNPATDLGLEDGDSIGFLLAGGNATGVLRGTAIISNASTDLVLTPGIASGTASTITGGLTLTSANGSTDNSFSYADLPVGTARHRGFGGGQGVDGYGVGNQYYDTRVHGFGGYGKDGAILLYY